MTDITILDGGQNKKITANDFILGWQSAHGDLEPDVIVRMRKGVVVTVEDDVANEMIDELDGLGLTYDVSDKY